jgi:hypothetical protein
MPGSAASFVTTVRCPRRAAAIRVATRKIRSTCASEYENAKSTQRPSEVHPADVLADDEEIDIVHVLRAKSAAFTELGTGLDGDDLAEEIERLAKVVDEAPPRRAAQERTAARERILAKPNHLRRERRFVSARAIDPVLFADDDVEPI